MSTNKETADTLVRLAEEGVELREAAQIIRSRGPGRPRHYAEATTSKGLRLPAPLWDELDTEAERRGISRAGLIVELLRAGLEADD